MGKRCLLILSLVLAAICSVHEIQAEPALSYLALCHKNWPCHASLKAFNGLPVIRSGWLEQTFGEDCSCANRLLQSHKAKVVRIHLANGACLRNGRCGRYEVFAGETIDSANRKIKRRDPTLFRRFRKVIRRVKHRLSAANGGLICYVSPVLESDLDARARNILRTITSRRLPGCSFVDSPHARPCLEGQICELHGHQPKLRSPCIADLDGTPLETISLAGFLRSTRSCDLQYLWTGEFNCNAYRNGKFVDPRERDCAVPPPLFERYGKLLRKGN
jgi:hypothetical protein